MLFRSARNDRVPYEKVDMLIAADGAVRELKVVGRDESVLSFVFDHEKVNPPVSDALFRFSIPPGAEVVNSVEFASQGK